MRCLSKFLTVISVLMFLICLCISRNFYAYCNGGVRVAEWLSHSTVVQEVPGSNPGAAESVGQ